MNAAAVEPVEVHGQLLWEKTLMNRFGRDTESEQKQPVPLEQAKIELNRTSADLDVYTSFENIPGPFLGSFKNAGDEWEHAKARWVNKDAL